MSALSAYFLHISLLLSVVLLAENGKAQPDSSIAATPPMGWSSWYPFVDTINEQKIMETADALVESGLRDLGYTIVQLDDGWMADTRDANGRQYANTQRFPRGLKFLADYLHDRGLKLGIYSSAGATTCAGYPGSFDHEELDAATYASWGIDYLKYDACGNKNGETDPALFNKMGAALRSTGRPIFFNICIFYSDTTHRWGNQLGNSWRTGEDIVKFIETNPAVTYQNWYHTLQTQVLGKEAFAGPGHWNDPDNLIVGYARNNQQTIAEQQAQFSFWALLAAPLFLGNDVRQMRPDIKKILTNSNVIAIDQDPLGKQGSRVYNSDSLEVWTKTLVNGEAILLYNKLKTTHSFQLPLQELQISGPVTAKDCWKNNKVVFLSTAYHVTLPPHGVWLLKRTNPVSN